MKSCVDRDRRKISAFWKPRQISDLAYCESKKCNRPNRRFGYFQSETLSSPKRTLHTVALPPIKIDSAEQEKHTDNYSDLTNKRGLG
jgi:hypothetical protein